MSLSQLAYAHLVLADENRATALQLMGVEPPSGRWPAVIAFYASIHYIQAYLWEHHQVQVRNHYQRQREIDDRAALISISANYRRLYDISLRARYHPSFSVTPAHARLLIQTDLAAIEVHVSELLSLNSNGRR